jgi:hypothetical protein
MRERERERERERVNWKGCDFSKAYIASEYTIQSTQVLHNDHRVQEYALNQRSLINCFSQKYIEVVQTIYIHNDQPKITYWINVQLIFT